MFVVGMQEIIPLTAKNVVSNSNSKQVEYWDAQILKCLNQNSEYLSSEEKYVKIRHEELVGIFVTIYIKRCLRPHVKDIVTSKVKLGMGNMGNKGCCGIRF
jgi:hypothetical protein